MACHNKGFKSQQHNFVVVVYHLSLSVQPDRLLWRCVGNQPYGPQPGWIKLLYDEREYVKLVSTHAFSTFSFQRTASNSRLPNKSYCCLMINAFDPPSKYRRKHHTQETLLYYKDLWLVQTEKSSLPCPSNHKTSHKKNRCNINLSAGMGKVVAAGRNKDTENVKMTSDCVQKEQRWNVHVRLVGCIWTGT